MYVSERVGSLQKRVLRCTGTCACMATLMHVHGHTCASMATLMHVDCYTRPQTGCHGHLQIDLA
eukprot:365819-Chlamydomonas_euryale.AAC.10